MVFVDLRTRLHHLLEDYGLLETFGRRHFYESVDDALAGMRGRVRDPGRRGGLVTTTRSQSRSPG